MKRFLYAVAIIIIGVLISRTATAIPTTYSDEALFRVDAAPTITYGFETHGFTETGSHTGDLASPLSASDLDNNFDLAYTNLNAFDIWDDAGSVWLTEGTHYLWTHSVPTANYTLTFSNFDGSNAAVTAFGLSIIDFASGITDPVTITYDAGGLTGNLLTVPAGQSDYTQNFLGLIVDSTEAFTTITLTMNDNLSGMQSFDEIIYSQAAPIPEPSTIVLFGIGFFGILVYVCRRKRNFVN